MKRPYVVAITGASGSIYAVRLLRFFEESRIPVELVVSETAKIVMKEELGIKEGEDILNKKEQVPSVRVHDFHDFTAPIASGSYPTEGMVIIPCSMGTLGAIAAGLSQNLIHRAADCTIKEGRKLVLVPRETPLSAIHLENMLKLARVGVKIVPPMPAFYGGQQTIEDIVDFVAGRVLDQLGMTHTLYPRWVGTYEKNPERLP